MQLMPLEGIEMMDNVQHSFLGGTWRNLVGQEALQAVMPFNLLEVHYET